MAGGSPNAKLLLTSKIRSFQIGVPSFSMGAAGGARPLECGSSFSLASTDSFRLRIFLIETSVVVSLAGREMAGLIVGGKAYQFAYRATNSPAPPWWLLDVRSLK